MLFKKTAILLIMTTITFGAAAQIDLHSHAVTEGYLTFIKEHRAAKEEKRFTLFFDHF